MSERVIAVAAAFVLAADLVVLGASGTSSLSIEDPSDLIAVPLDERSLPSPLPSITTPEAPSVVLPSPTLPGDPSPSLTPPSAPQPTVPELPPLSGAPDLRGHILFTSNQGSPPPQPSSGPVTPSARGYNLWVADGDGANIRPLSTTGHNSSADLSPDGRHITWIASDRQIWTMRTDGFERRQVGACPLSCTQPNWSRDGSRIAFVAHENADSSEIIIVNSDGSDARTVPTSFVPYSALWAPKSDVLAVSVSISSGDRGLWIIDPNDGSAQELRNEMTVNVAWHPTGDRVMFSNQTTMFTMVVATGETTEILPGETAAPGVGVPSRSGQYLGGAWSPDGANIAYMHFPGRDGLKTQLWLLDVNSREAVQLTDGSFTVSQVSY